MTTPLDPHCLFCGRTAGLDTALSPSGSGLLAIYCRTCRRTTLVQMHVTERCTECGGDRQAHVEGCGNERLWAV
jgi:hypothetical protein